MLRKIKRCYIVSLETQRWLNATFIWFFVSRHCNAWLKRATQMQVANVRKYTVNSRNAKFNANESIYACVGSLHFTRVNQGSTNPMRTPPSWKKTSTALAYVSVRSLNVVCICTCNYVCICFVHACEPGLTHIFYPKSRLPAGSGIRIYFFFHRLTCMSI